MTDMGDDLRKRVERIEGELGIDAEIAEQREMVEDIFARQSGWEIEWVSNDGTSMVSVREKLRPDVLEDMMDHFDYVAIHPPDGDEEEALFFIRGAYNS